MTALEFAPTIPGATADKIGDKWPTGPTNAIESLAHAVDVADAFGEPDSNWVLRSTGHMYRVPGTHQWKPTGITYGDLREILAALRD